MFVGQAGLLTVALMLELLLVMFECVAVYIMLATDLVSEAGNAIGIIHPSVYLLPLFELSDP